MTHNSLPSSAPPTLCCSGPGSSSSSSQGNFSSGCCASEHGKCAVRRREGAVGALLVGLEGGASLAGSYFGEL